MDISPTYRAGAKESFPLARIVFNRFHLMQMAGQALGEVRKSLRRVAGGLWSLRGNQWTRTEEQQQTREALCRRLEPFCELATTIRAHCDGVVAFLETTVTISLIKAINGLLQLAKRMACGFRSFKHIQDMAYPQSR